MRLHPHSYRRVFTLVATFILALTALPVGSAGAQTYTVLHAFGSGTDGVGPGSGVSLFPAGKTSNGLFGTTEDGGASGYGITFRLAPIFGGGYTYSVVNSFTYSDGAYPDVTMSTYVDAVGTTYSGGTTGNGTVYDLKDVSGEFEFGSTLYNFCSVAGCSDGAHPEGAVVASGATFPYVYGTTKGGGTVLGLGTVFKVDISISAETVVHAFAGGTDGGSPVAGLTLSNPDFSSSVTLYGTTSGGGVANDGTVFQVIPSTGAYLLLHSFSGPDGSVPSGGVIQSFGGSLYGTTYDGGAYGYGVLFEISTAGVFTVLHSFTGGSDGAFPQGTPWVDPSGNIYGTASRGGTAGWGTLFEIPAGGAFTVLHNFCSTAGCADGVSPEGPLTPASYATNPVLWGTTLSGGPYSIVSGGEVSGGGVVFEWQP